MIAYFNKMKIKPNDATPEVRAAQLAAMQQNNTDAYFDQQKEQFIANSVAAGYDPNVIRGFV
jgi:hypothetical protein